jgi:hypothetical protein
MHEVFAHMSGTYDTLKEPALQELFGSLAESVDKLSCSCAQFERMVSENVNKFYKFYGNEVMAGTELAMEWEKAKVQYQRERSKLSLNKKELFDKKDIEKWQIDIRCPIPVEALLNRKEVAFKEMLPTETARVASFQVIYGYYSNKLREECRRLCLKDAAQIKEHMAKVASASSDALEQVQRLLISLW